MAQKGTELCFGTSGLAYDDVPENSDAAHHILNDYQSTT
jgi:hypothetical protein